MFYTIYKITNKVNGKIYIGKHQTKDLDDGYMGSGKWLKYAIQKYGIESFTKEILHVFDNEQDMNAKEKELVTEEFVKENTNYNLCPGGQGGWGYINQLERSYEWRMKLKKACKKGGIATSNRIKNDPEFKKMFSQKTRKAYLTRRKNGWKSKGTSGMKLSEETKRKMSESQSGTKNSQYGTMWITDGNKSRKINKNELIPEGWYKGRIMRV